MDTLEKIPWYRTRKFWGVVLSVGFLLNLLILLYAHENLFGAYANLFNGLLVASGSGIVWVILISLNLIENANILASIIYLPIFLFLAFKTFRQKKVSPFYPILIFLLMLLSAAVAFISFGSYA